MRRSPNLYAGLAVVLLAIVAAGSGVIAWVNRPAANEARLVKALTSATGANIAPYTQAAFDKAQAEGDTIIVAIHAGWCPTCAAQKPILERIAAEGSKEHLRVLLVDFDKQKDVVRKLGATMQSTLVVFHGKQEMVRTVGDTDADSIRMTIRRSLV